MSDKLIIGMMSGTSVDGIDAALVRFTDAGELDVLDTLFTAFDARLREQVNELAHANQIENCNDTPLHEDLAHLYANAALALAQKAQISVDSISAIANHGQTVRHEPNAQPGFSIQLGNAQSIADLTGLITIGNFRQADLQAGGQGAPLMPAFHAHMFGGENRYLLNIGGIANITQLGDTVIGFDTGPGNTLLDQWIFHTQQRSYDADGAWAASGEVQSDLLNRFLSDPYFSQSFPKSTGPDYFNLAWLGDVSMYQPVDVQATLLELTVQTIVGEIRQLGNVAGDIYVCGGGAHNHALMTRLGSVLDKYTIRPSDELGIPADWVEAVGFAWLGYQRLQNLESNLPSVTGAEKSVSLGEVYLPRG